MAAGGSAVVELHTRLLAIFQHAEAAGPNYWLCCDAMDHTVFYGNRKRRDAAVLCCIREVEGRMEVLLTKRSEQLRSHSGEGDHSGESG